MIILHMLHSTLTKPQKENYILRHLWDYVFLELDEALPFLSSLVSGLGNIQYNIVNISYNTDDVTAPQTIP